MGRICTLAIKEQYMSMCRPDPSVSFRELAMAWLPAVEPN